MLENLDQFYFFLACLAIGAICGVFFSLSNAIKFIFSKKLSKIFGIITDFFAFVLTTLTYIIFGNLFNFPSIRFYMPIGVIIGIIAGILATGAVWGIYEFALGSFTAMLSGFGSSAKIEFLDYALYLAAAFVGIGIFTGIFGSATSIRKYLKERKFVELEE